MCTSVNISYQTESVLYSRDFSKGCRLVRVIKDPSLMDFDEIGRDLSIDLYMTIGFDLKRLAFVIVRKRTRTSKYHTGSCLVASGTIGNDIMICTKLELEV